ncbi:polyprenyl diphosphate synthase [uncultured Bilophila sp.]|uniref:polyprenyl diphosphate synthase n=1 Tax=uncultured Bilophila sp. TaxID=529385 RepID=UPI0025E263A6|nr:polyprenyl diphosphate synthase [uncultured Bilophila sp.]
MPEPSLPIPASALPAHIAVIMDGNGRWAQERGLSRSEGHKAGVRAAKAIVTECRTIGIRHLTLYTFSQENWGRPKDEVSLLFQLLVSFLGDELPSMERNGISLRVFGDLDGLPLAARTALRHAISRTSRCSDMIVNLALNYSGREEILRAARTLIRRGVRPEDVTEDAFRECLYSAGQPDPDLLIRTSGELRTSNYLPFQSAYSELYFTTTYWPDFTPAELHKALRDYAGRSRRFGLTQEQIQ